MTNKTLYIILHAKAEDHALKEKDFDRNLIDKGRHRAKLIAEKLKQDIHFIDGRTLFLSSTANRAAETAEIFSHVLGYSTDAIKWESQIYEAHYLVILKCINNISANYDNVLVFGHNPGLSDLVNYVSDQYVNLKTSHVACLTLEEEIDYSILSANTAHLKKLIEG